ncbi:MAG: beta-hexosaminidase [Alphaproteobacteria bacterium]|nr:beta-hexosaminidase [Alphaproteobacteria bacterium]
MAQAAAIFDTEGPRPTRDERAFFREADPVGFILFADHCASREDARALVSELSDCVGRDNLLFLIDQEGGRVARMKPPVFPAFHPPARLGELYRLDRASAAAAARLTGFLLGRMVSAVGINVNCAPMLDVPQIDSDQVVLGDRALARHPDIVAALGRAMAVGLKEGGALPVMKHLPGHGRSIVDSHATLPRVSASLDDLRKADFAPFKALNDLLMGMTAHIVYDAIDPDAPATLSGKVISETIRQEIGFGGLLFSDDLRMGALGGPIGPRACAALEAGCDIALCCNYTLGEKIETMASDIALRPSAQRRLDRVLNELPAREADGAFEEEYAELEALLRPVVVA